MGKTLFVLVVICAIGVIECVALDKTGHANSLEAGDQLQLSEAEQKMYAEIDARNEAALKVTVQTKVFAYHGFMHTTGSVSMPFGKEGHELSASEWSSMRKHHWYNVEDDASPLKKLGYEAWQPTAEGLRFRNRQGEDVICHPNMGTSSANADATHVHYDCDFDGDRKSLLESDETAFKPSHEGDFAGYLDREDYDDHQKGEMWVPAENGVPYGWNRLFASFGFPYFTVTPKGFLGCYKLDHGMCSMTPTSFASTQLQPPLKTPGGPPERTDLTPAFPHGTEYVNYDDLRTKPEDVTQREH